MKKISLKKIHYLIVVLASAFIILSAFDCIEQWLVYMVEYQGIPAGTSIQIDSMNNAFPCIAGVGLVQIIFILLNRKKCQITNIILAVISMLICHRVFLIGIIGSLYAGGLGTYTYKLTSVGYIVLILSWLLLLLHIRLYGFMKKVRNS